MSRFLDDFRAFILENRANIYAIAEYTPEGGVEMLSIQPANACNNIYSVSKVFTATAIGMLVDRGLLSTDETVPAILREECPAGYVAHWNDVTVDMLLRHRVGLPGGALDIDCLDASTFDPDYLHEVMRTLWDCPPDTRRSYTDAAFYVLSRIVARRAGKPLQLFLWENLFAPLGFREAAWSCCPRGHAMGATGLYIRCDDMVKLGAVYLQGGLWQGRRIVSEAWVRTTLERGYELARREGGAYAKGGMFGQQLMLLPGQRVVGWIGHRRGEGASLSEWVMRSFVTAE